MDEEKIREEIFEKIKSLYMLRKEDEKFIPGKTPVNYAGRIYDENEMISLVDSALGEGHILYSAFEMISF